MFWSEFIYIAKKHVSPHVVRCSTNRCIHDRIPKRDTLLFLMASKRNLRCLQHRVDELFILPE